MIARARSIVLFAAACGVLLAWSCQPEREALEEKPQGGPEAPGTAGPPVKDLSFFLRQLVDLDRLAVLEEGTRTAQFSSYDRKSRLDENGKKIDWDANGDAGQYLRIEPSGEAVMAEMEGPGCIRRIWSANPQGRIRFYFDGSEVPSMDLDFNALFSGKIQPFLWPFVWQRRLFFGGSNLASDCYLPIPYAKTCKVTADKAHNQYFHIGYSTFPPGFGVKTFSPSLTPGEGETLVDLVKILSSPGEDTQPVPGLKSFALQTALGPGEQKEFAKLEGPGVIRKFRAKARTLKRWGPRKILLEIFWDGEKAPAVQAPLGDFFGDAWDEATYKSLPLGIADDLNYCYFRMPFERSARVVLTNIGTKPAEVRLEVAWLPGKLPPGSARFHARWRRDRESRDFDYPLLECAGRGRFIGVALFIHNIVGGWWGEGDEKAYVDGEKFPSTFGTGSEDYFGDAWGIRYFANPFHGCPTREEGPRQSCYRWHIADDIPFTKSFKIDIENYAALGKEAVRNDYSSVAYWYQEAGGSDFFQSVPLKDYVPQGRVVPGALEAESLVDPGALPDGAALISDEALPAELSGGKALEISGPAGARVSLDLTAPEEGRYAIETVPAPGPKAPPFEVLKDGKPAGDQVRLSKGKNRIEVRLSGLAEGGRTKLVLDYFLLHPWRNFLRRWYLIGPFDNTEGAGFERPYGPEKEPFRPDQAFAALGGEARWQKVEAPSGLVTSNGKHFKQKDDIVLYATCEVESPAARKAAAFVGSDDGVKVWVNGKLVHSQAARRGLVPDQDRLEIDLKEGRNRILLKVDQGGGPWGFSFRIDDPEEKLRTVLPE